MKSCSDYGGAVMTSLSHAIQCTMMSLNKYSQPIVLAVVQPGGRGTPHAHRRLHKTTDKGTVLIILRDV